MQTNDGHNERVQAGVGSGRDDTARGTGNEAALTKGDGAPDGDGRERNECTPGRVGSFWSEDPVSPRVREFAGHHPNQGPTVIHDTGDPDSSVYETNYGDEAQDSSDEGSWNVPAQDPPSRTEMCTNE